MRCGGLACGEPLIVAVVVQDRPPEVAAEMLVEEVAGGHRSRLAGRAG